MSELKPIKIDIVSDVVCPWCVVGYRNLAQALEQLQASLAPQVAWHPFELNPMMGPDGQEIREHLAEKYGSSVQDSEGVRARLTAMGSASGFTFNWTPGMRIYNTFDCHRLLAWAATKGKQHELQMALFSQYFTDNLALNDQILLLDTVARIGLPVDEAEAVLASEQFSEETKQALSHFKNMGIQAVPTFIINDRYSISGGQAVAVFVQALTQIAQETA